MRAEVRFAPVVLLVLAVASIGCAAGNHHAYDQGDVFLYDHGSGQVALAVQDCRPAVVSGEKTPDFVGLQRGGFGNPFDVTTESGQPLAEDATVGLRRSLMAAGYHVRPMSTVTSQSFRDVVEDLERTHAPRLLIVRINQWKADTAVKTGLEYNLTVDVMDGRGARLARATVRGRDDLGGSLLATPAHAKEVAPRAFWTKMTRLMNEDVVSKALTSAAAVASPDKSPAVPSPTAQPSTDAAERAATNATAARPASD
jgi:hypothetical protein